MPKFKLGDWVEVVNRNGNFRDELLGAIGPITHVYNYLGPIEYEICIEALKDEGPYRRVAETQIVLTPNDYQAACLKLGEEYFA